MERCPICRARLKGEWRCPRCGADLSLPLKIEQRAQSLEQDAVMRLAKGEMEQAHQVLNKALRLKPSPLIRVLLRFVHENQ
jgi:tRNA(Ile2) C34 agmatinyltransferase TiaS